MSAICDSLVQFSQVHPILNGAIGSAIRVVSLGSIIGGQELAFYANEIEDPVKKSAFKVLGISLMVFGLLAHLGVAVASTIVALSNPSLGIATLSFVGILAQTAAITFIFIRTMKQVLDNKGDSLINDIKGLKFIFS